MVTNYDIIDNSVHCTTAVTVNPNCDYVSEQSWCVNQCTAVVADSNPEKYDLDQRFRPRHRESIAKAKQCKLFKNWDKQTVDKYGFIPLSEMILPEKKKKNLSFAAIFDIHKSIVDTQTHNFLNAQIQIKSKLNPDVWDRYLEDYWDKQLPLLIRYGFPLDFNPVSPLYHEEFNHASTNLFEGNVAHYLQGEASFKLF